MNPESRVCSVCGNPTNLVCSDCVIDLHTEVFVCSTRSCRDQHEMKCPHVLLTRIVALVTAMESPIGWRLGKPISQEQIDWLFKMRSVREEMRI